MTTLLNIAIPNSLRNLLGSALIIVCSINIGVNLSVMAYTSIKEMFTSFTAKKIKKRLNKAI